MNVFVDIHYTWMHRVLFLGTQLTEIVHTRSA